MLCAIYKFGDAGMRIVKNAIVQLLQDVFFNYETERIISNKVY